MANNCLNCKHIKTIELLDPCYCCENFGHWEQKPKPTNADRIRAMSDEELADILGDQRICCEYCEGCETYVDLKVCREHVLAWLRKETDDRVFM